MNPIVKVFADQGCQSYWIACRATRKALLVDPKVGRRESYRKAAAAFGLQPVAVVDTHTHADHLSDSAFFEKAGLALYMSRHTGCRRRVKRLGDGDALRVGELELTAIEVPGHTDDSIALAGGGCALTGDALLIGTLGRTDFRGSDPARLFESVTSRLLALPDATVVLPGHDYRDVLFSTIGVERRKNAAFGAKDARAYAAAKQDVPGRGNSPEVDAMLATNLEADPELPATGAATVACCDGGSAAPPVERAREEGPSAAASKREALAARGAWIDVRDPYEYSAGHVPGAINVPLGELGFHLESLPRAGELLLSCQGGVRSMTAARTLRYLGVHLDPTSMAGGYAAWEKEGLPVER